VPHVWMWPPSVLLTSWSPSECSMWLFSSKKKAVFVEPVNECLSSEERTQGLQRNGNQHIIGGAALRNVNGGHAEHPAGIAAPRAHTARDRRCARAAARRAACRPVESTAPSGRVCGGRGHAHATVLARRARHAPPIVAVAAASARPGARPATSNCQRGEHAWPGQALWTFHGGG